MRNINEYKRRFNTLLESTMGNVKPLISEAPEFEEFVVPTLDMFKKIYVESYETEDMNQSKELNVKTSLNGNEFKITLPEGVYFNGEYIGIEVSVDRILKMVWDVSSPIEGPNIEHTEPCCETTTETGFRIWFRLPETQEEFLKNQPYNLYVDVRFVNVRGGKLRFSIEIPSGSELFSRH